jgi:hypothetical protein
MKKLFLCLLIFLFSIFVDISAGYASRATMDEALTVAKNWTKLIADKKTWGGSRNPQVEEGREFTRKGRVLGYYYPVKPIGYIIISLYKELAPVKAYSTSSNLDPGSEEGMADLLKGAMERTLDRMQDRFGRVHLDRREGLGQALPVDYRQSWEQLGIQSEGAKALKDSDVGGINYAAGQVLTSSEWHQDAPYNDQCPPGPTCAHTVVGCVATAGAQIMYYWSWPPYGTEGHTYYWPAMSDVYTGSGSAFEEAKLSHEVGVAVGMDYGCGESSAQLGDMEDAYHNQFRLFASEISRDSYTATEWFDWLKSQFNINQPVHYRIEGHEMVGGGWEEVGSPPSRYFHINFGWGPGSDNTWYELDDPTLGSLGEQKMLVYIYPNTSLPYNLWGNYPLDPSFPYRYFTRDSVNYLGDNVIFDSGQYLQFLPGIKVNGQGSVDSGITVYGSASNNTKLISKGDTTKGIRIGEGAIRLTNNGSLSLRPLQAPRYFRVFDFSSPPSYAVWLGWQHASGQADGFIVERIGNGTVTRTVLGPDRKDLWDYDVLPGKSYFYSVQAFRGGGQSDPTIQLGVAIPGP